MRRNSFLEAGTLAEFAFAFLDCEFGGLDPERHDITEVGVIVTDYRLVEQCEGHWRVAARPDRISAEAAKIFGYDEKLWADAPHVRTVLTEIAELLPKGVTVVPAGQNVRMDVIFLERAYRNCEIAYPFDYHVIDLATLYYAWTPGRRRNSSSALAAPGGHASWTPGRRNSAPGPRRCAADPGNLPALHRPTGSPRPARNSAGAPSRNSAQPGSPSLRCHLRTARRSTASRILRNRAASPRDRLPVEALAKSRTIGWPAESARTLLR